MEPSEPAAAALRVLTGDDPATAGQKASLQELVWGRLGRSNLGASALTRLHERPDEGSAAIVASVLADDTRADPELTARVADALRPQPEPRVQAGAPQAPLRAGAPSAPLPPRPTAPPPRAPGPPRKCARSGCWGCPR